MCSVYSKVIVYLFASVNALCSNTRIKRSTVKRCKCVEMKEIQPYLFYEPGKKEDIEIWTIKDSMPSGPVCFKTLHDEEVCLVLETRISISGVAAYHLHIWVGARANDEDLTHATRHAAALDLMLRRRTTVHLERQHQECDRFLAYFGPCIEYSPGARPSRGEPRGNTLYALYSRGKYTEVRQVKCSVSSINKLDPLVLVTQGKEELTVYQLPLSWDKRVVKKISIHLQVNEWFVRNHHLDYECYFIRLDKDSIFTDWEDFYKALGCEDLDTLPAIPEGKRREEQTCKCNYKLFEILRNCKGHIYYKYMRLPARKEDLDSRSLYILSNGQYDVNLWVGKNNQDRNKAKMYGLAKIQEFMTHFKLTSCAHMAVIPEGLEPIYFKEQFKSWI